jgi:hypothetical protein
MPRAPRYVDSGEPLERINTCESQTRLGQLLGASRFSSSRPSQRPSSGPVQQTPHRRIPRTRSAEHSSMHAYSRASANASSSSSKRGPILTEMVSRGVRTTVLSTLGHPSFTAARGSFAGDQTIRTSLITRSSALDSRLPFKQQEAKASSASGGAVATSQPPNRTTPTSSTPSTSSTSRAPFRSSQARGRSTCERSNTPRPDRSTDRSADRDQDDRVLHKLTENADRRGEHRLDEPRHDRNPLLIRGCAGMRRTAESQERPRRGQEPNAQLGVVAGS